MTGSAKMVEERVVVLGGRGMLGTDLAVALQQKNVTPIVFDLPQFDITNKQQLEKAIERAQVIINCAAYTNVEKAESEPDLAYKVNAEAVGNLGSAAKKTGAWVLHISTDFVFDGKSDTPYVETDQPNPINTYGKSKLAGEQLLLESGCKNCIMRLEWTYGMAGNNFVTKLISSARQGKKLKVVDDQIGSPTATTQVAEAIYKILTLKPEGIFHFANAGFVSRYEMAKFIFEKFKIDADLDSCKSSDYKTAAQRPLNSRFNCDKIKALLGEDIEHWQIPLERFLEQL